MAYHQVKVVGANGQISLGKELAGKMVLIDQIDEGIWIIKSGKFIPDSEKWLYEKNHLDKLDKSLDWAKKNKPKDNLKQVLKNRSE